MSIRHYKRVISLLTEAAVITTPDSGTILAANPPAIKLLNSGGTTPGSLFEYVTASAIEDAASYLRHCARSAQPLVGALMLNQGAEADSFTCYGAALDPRTDTSEAVILLRIHPRQKANARFQALKQQIDDLNQEVARRLRAEYQLKRQTRWLEVTLTSIGDAVITTNADNRVAFMNPVAEAMTGWSQHEAHGKPLEEVFVIVNEYTGATVENPASKALRQQSVVGLANHTVLISRHGKRTSIEDTAAPITLDDEVKGVILVFHDVSDRRLLERQLMERAETLEIANRRKNEFLTMLAHELRSPLTPISNAVQIMNLQAGPSDTNDAHRRVIERQVQHLKRLIDDMLDVSRITRGKMNIVRENVDLTALVGWACGDFRPRFEQAGIRFETDVPSSALWIDADAHRITQVLHNILGNAAKFTPAGGSTKVTLEAEGHSAVLRVTDTGVGIEKSVLTDMFEPFTQATQNLDRNEGGLGLGLSLVKGIVDLHHGHVSVYSAGRDQGATITIELPLTDHTALAPATAHYEEVEKNHRIVLIEDEEDAADTMQQLLELLGHDVHVARTGPEGLKKVAALQPTLIICDIGLPGLDGFEVAQRLRDSAVTASIPLVALTGYGESDFIARAKASGFDHHITKPAGMEDIQAAVALANTTDR